MPGSQTTQGRSDTRAGASSRLAFRQTYGVGTLWKITFAAQWLAYTLPCRRFADILTGACARLGVNVDRYSFTATDLHRLLLAGLPAHKLLIYWWDGWPPNCRSMCLFPLAFLVTTIDDAPISAPYHGWLSPDVAGLFSLVHIRA